MRSFTRYWTQGYRSFRDPRIAGTCPEPDRPLTADTRRPSPGDTLRSGSAPMTARSKTTRRKTKKTTPKRMPKPKAAKKQAKGGRTKRASEADVLDRLAPEEAAEVLRELLDTNRSLRPTANEIATRRITDVDAKRIAKTLCEELLALDVFAFDGRAGRTQWGYVGPTEAAWEILEETAQPFIDNAIRLAELGHDDAALAACRGVLLGLYAVRDKGADDLLGHAPDFPDETAAHALDQFRNALGRRPGKADKLREMVAGMNEWDWLDRVIAGRR